MTPENVMLTLLVIPIIAFLWIAMIGVASLLWRDWFGK